MGSLVGKTTKNRRGVNTHLSHGHQWNLHKTDEKFLGTRPRLHSVIRSATVLSSW